MQEDARRPALAGRSLDSWWAFILLGDAASQFTNQSKKMGLDRARCACFGACRFSTPVAVRLVTVKYFG